MVFLKNCEPELSYILAEILNVSEGVLFSRFWKVPVVPELKNVEKSSAAKKLEPY